MRSLRPTGWCRARTHTLTSSPSGVVDRQRATLNRRCRVGGISSTSGLIGERHQSAARRMEPPLNPPLLAGNLLGWARGAYYWPVHSARRAKAHKRAAFPKDHDLTVSDGTRIAYTFRGDGPGMPVVFVNGWSCTDGYWTTIGPAVAAAGHRTIFLDMRGHGESGLPRRPGIAARDLWAEDVAPERLAADIVEVLDDAGVERAVLVATPWEYRPLWRRAGSRPSGSPASSRSPARSRTR
jgi:hypothetical protein